MTATDVSAFVSGFLTGAMLTALGKAALLHIRHVPWRFLWERG